jgi:oxygen-independent coproporphyrinogen-3 oxidase
VLLYVHIPYCVHKCHYCDFNSHAVREPAWEQYRRGLVNELRHWAVHDAFAGRTINSIFFGGGTPSLAPARLLGDVIDMAAGLFGLASDAEITMEANPGTVEAARFADYRRAGINRLSIGVQSLDDTELRWLERIHTSAEAVAAFDTARHAGFDNMNLDLMYALPGQSLQRWQQTLAKAIDMGPEHLSCYQLTVEPHTKLAARHASEPLALPEDEAALDFFRATRERLAEAGYAAYEVSNFAKAGLHCRHNDGYWLYRDYIGIGAGASGKWDEADGGVTRYSNLRSPEPYTATALKEGRAINSSESLALRQAAAEAVWLGLRRHEGISLQGFESRFGTPLLQLFGRELAGWQREGHLETVGGLLRLTARGLPFADAIAADLF